MKNAETLFTGNDMGSSCAIPFLGPSLFGHRAGGEGLGVDLPGGGQALDRQRQHVELFREGKPDIPPVPAVHARRAPHGCHRAVAGRHGGERFGVRDRQQLLDQRAQVVTSPRQCRAMSLEPGFVRPSGSFRPGCRDPDDDRRARQLRRGRAWHPGRGCLPAPGIGGRLLETLMARSGYGAFLASVQADQAWIVPFLRRYSQIKIEFT